jgi:hypothetical protein
MNHPSAPFGAVLLTPLVFVGRPAAVFIVQRESAAILAGQTCQPGVFGASAMPAVMTNLLLPPRFRVNH